MPAQETNRTPDHPVTTPVADRRREVRYPCRDSAEMRSLDDLGPSHPATVLDISKSGIRVESNVNVAKGSHVEILIRKHAVIFGEVRHCRADGMKYQIGILIEQVFYASEHIDHISDETLRSYLAGAGLTAREVLAVTLHVRGCHTCSTRIDDAMSVSEAVGRGRLAER
ncbi:MAG TPA: PilZ domain-containing protein [Bryobacteraceae bacterium]|nr:PilZ domain-containing protein [Bryobacteraceae bacterium]